MAQILTLSRSYNKVCCLILALIAIPVSRITAAPHPEAVSAKTQSQVKRELVNGVLGHAPFKLSRAAHNKATLVLFGPNQALSLGEGKSLNVPMVIKLSFGTKPMIAPNKQYAFNTDGAWQGNAPMIGETTIQKGTVANEVLGQYDLKLQFFELKDGLLSGYISLTSSQLSGVNVKGFFYAAEKAEPSQP